MAKYLITFNEMHRFPSGVSEIIDRHPALAVEARVALTLRLLGGLTVAEIARAFLVQETTMAQRITRGKAKIKAAHIPYRVPSGRTSASGSAGCSRSSIWSSTRVT